MHITRIAFCAFAFAGIIRTIGMVDVIFERLLKIANTIEN